MPNVPPPDRSETPPTPLRSLARRELRPTPSLPMPLTSLVGREREIADVVALLRREGLRLLTLVGPGDVGKTRLALEAASRVAADFSDGVAFVPLAPIRDPGLVASAIAQAFGLWEVGNKPPLEGIRAFLHAKNLLLVLDNFEHLVDAAPLVIDLLMACPQLTVLVTSRCVLHVSGEHTVLVRPLALPDPSRPASIDQARRAAAVQLFLDRAIAARDDFSLTLSNVADVAAICQRVDGLPLAIELAAARVRHLPVATLHARLDRQLALLAGGPRDQPARLRSMREAIAWSFDHLTSEEQAVFQRLAVFVGGCTLEAAETVCGEATADVLECLASLVDTSLLLQEERPRGKPRYTMLETLREYGLDQLQASGDAARVRAKHAAHYLDLAEVAEPELQGPSQDTWLDRLADEHDNLRAVLAWACAEEDVELGLRLAGALWRFWMVRSHIVEGRAWLEAVLALPSGTPHTSARAKALARVADLVRRCGDEAQARGHSQKSLAIWRELGDRAAAASELTHLGRMALAAGELVEARAALEEALAIELEQGDQSRAAQSLLCLGRVAYFEGDFATARHLTEESLALHQALGDSIGTVWALQSLAHTAVADGLHSAARAAIAEGLAAAQDVGYAWGLTVMLEAAAALAAAEGRPKHALRLAAAAAALREPLGSALAPDWRTDLDHLLAPARRVLGPAAVAAVWAEGRAWSQERALVEALIPAAASTSALLPSAPGPDLTRREREVLRLLAEGQSNREIAADLSISVLTAKTHVERILSKLGLHSRAAAAAYAYQHQLA